MTRVTCKPALCCIVSLTFLTSIGLEANPVMDQPCAERPKLQPGESNWIPRNGGEQGRAPGLSTADLDSGLTPADLVDTLLGVGVAVSNVTYNGMNIAAGTFTGGLGIIGFDSGIILSSGNIASVPGPNAIDDTTTNLGLPGDADLDNLIPGYTTYDATILEFDFACEGVLVIQFQYVFTSEEYNEWVNSPYNDVFGFFLNGTNIALVPGAGTLPVAINNVNCNNPFAPPAGSFCSLYINNDLEDGGGTVDTEMDGLTTVFTATATVNPGLNHIKLAISDAGDPILDSNVFIKAQSFACQEPVGACCNASISFCVDGVLATDCQGPDENWSVGLQCAELDPPCSAIGACCLPLGGCLDDQTEPSCDAFGGRWVGPDTVCLGDDDGDGFDDACNQLPVCDAGGPYFEECQGAVTTLEVDGNNSFDPDGGELTFFWSTDCPGGSFDDPANDTPHLTIPSAGPCSLHCRVTLTVSDGVNQQACSALVTIDDTIPPVIECPAFMIPDCDGFVPSAIVTDMCDPAPMVTYNDNTPNVCMDPTDIPPTVRTWRTDDACGNRSECEQTFGQCEPDCNSNEVPDRCDIESGASPDENADGIPDECQSICTTPTLLEAQSLVRHDTGDFYISLDLTNNPATRTSEPRSAGLQVLEFLFDRPLLSGSITINGGPAYMMELRHGETLGHVDLGSPLPDQAVYTITVHASTGPGCDLIQDICVVALVGDFDSSGAVTAADKGQLVGFFGQTVEQVNARFDVEVGHGTTINVFDIGFWTGFFGHSVTATPFCP